MDDATRKILGLEIGGGIFILLIGSALHFTFELANFWKPIAVIAPVNESIWEHLKMVFWPGLFFSLIQYHFVKNLTTNYWSAKALSLVFMPLFITAGWFAFAVLTGANNFAVNIVLFVIAIILGQAISFKMLTSARESRLKPVFPILCIVVLGLSFGLFSFFPPRIGLFEHMDLMNTGQYGILDSYEGLLIFRK